MNRTEEQVEAVAELTDREIADFRKFEALPEDAVGMSDIDKSSCWINGHDTASELGITNENGFTNREISNAEYRHTLGTAKLFELI
jgi:hypothetical protein